MRYSLPEVLCIFRERFECKPPLDGLMMALLNRPVIDLIKFDEILQERHGDKYRNASMKDILEREYPAGTADFIEWLIGAKE